MSARPTPETDKAKCKFASLFGDNEDAYWVHFKVAETLERERDELRSDLEFRRGLFQLQEKQLNEVRAELDALQEQLDAAIILGKMQERRHERELEQVREQYRLSSICRKLMIENQKLK